MWFYYSYNSEYKRKPDDLEDLLDGLICIRAKNELERIDGENE